MKVVDHAILAELAVEVEAEDAVVVVALCTSSVSE